MRSKAKNDSCFDYIRYIHLQYRNIEILLISIAECCWVSVTTLKMCLRGRRFQLMSGSMWQKQLPFSTSLLPLKIDNSVYIFIYHCDPKESFFPAPALTPICAMRNRIFPLLSRTSGIPAEQMTISCWTLLQKEKTEYKNREINCSKHSSLCNLT